MNYLKKFLIVCVQMVLTLPVWGGNTEAKDPIINPTPHEVEMLSDEEALDVSGGVRLMDRSGRFADAVVCLNRRDAGQITRIYHRKPDAIAPLSLEDHFDETRLHAAPDTVGAFIGSNFYANYYGVKWFAENVAPHISTKILIIGKGFEKCRNEFAGIDRIRNYRGFSRL